MVELKKDKAPLFYPLTNQEWRETVKDLTGAEIKVLYHLRSLDPFGDRLIEYSITQIADDLGLSKGAVSKAVKKLDQMDLIDAELVRVKIRIKPNNNNVIEFPKKNNVSYKKQEFPIGNEDFPEETEISHRKQPLPIGNEQQPEPLSDEASSTPHTIKTYSYFIQTLSEGERKSFLEFGKKKAAELKNPPVQLPLKWIETHFEELKDLWEKHKSSTGSTHCGATTSTNASTHCEAAASTNVQNFESWEVSSHEGQYHSLKCLGLAKFCLNAISKAWYEWANAKHPERFINVPE